jgi:hypothetical protein
LFVTTRKYSEKISFIEKQAGDDFASSEVTASVSKLCNAYKNLIVPMKKLQ